MTMIQVMLTDICRVCMLLRLTPLERQTEIERSGREPTDVPQQPLLPLGRALSRSYVLVPQDDLEPPTERDEDSYDLDLRQSSPKKVSQGGKKWAVTCLRELLADAGPRTGTEGDVRHPGLAVLLLLVLAGR